MTDRHIELLTEAHDFAVAQMGGRRFPGVVFQGDSLHVLINQIELIERMSSTYSDRELSKEIADVLELLRDVRAGYEAVCKANGRGLPYERRV
jgi:hypothetical protein